MTPTLLSLVLLKWRRRVNYFIALIEAIITQILLFTFRVYVGGKVRIPTLLQLGRGSKFNTLNLRPRNIIRGYCFKDRTAALP